MTRRWQLELLGAAVALLAAALLALLGLDVLRWQSALGDGDARFAAAPTREEPLWDAEATLPGGLAERLLDVGDDLAYRHAVRLYARSRPGEPVAHNPRREVIRAEAQRALTAVSRDDPTAARRARTTMLLGMLGVGRGDLFTSPEERLQVLRSVAGNWQVALELDPGLDEAKRNLELLLAEGGAPVAGATDPAQGSSRGSSTGAGRSGSGY